MSFFISSDSAGQGHRGLSAEIVGGRCCRVAPRLRRKGFTLIELMVVISIVAMLISILLPALKSARESGRTVKCLSNIRQVGVAGAIYFMENKDRFPAAYTAPGGGMIAEFPRRAISHIMTGKMEANPTTPGMICPTSVKGGVIDSYGFNNGWSGWSARFRNVGDPSGGAMDRSGAMLMDVVNPSSKVYAMDFSHHCLEFWFNSVNISHSNLSFVPGAGKYGVTNTGFSMPVYAPYVGEFMSGRHGNNQNILYVDGHAASVQQIFAVEKYHKAGAAQKLALNNMYNLYKP